MKWLKVDRGMLNLEHVSFFALEDSKGKQISFYFKDFRTEPLRCDNDTLTCELYYAIMKKIESKEIIIDVVHEMKQIKTRFADDTK